MLSNLLRLVIIVCIHGIKATKRWFRESPTELGGHNLSVPTAYLGPKERKQDRGDYANRITKYMYFPSLALWLIQVPVPKNSLFPRFFFFFFFRKLVGGI